jgi:hypothetical protein
MEPDAKTILMLQAELKRLKNMTTSGQQLTVAWAPQKGSSLAGEVKDDVIFVYEEKSQEAVDTLRHEFFDYLICRAIRPYEQTTLLYKAMLNGLLEKLGEDAYIEKERVAEALARIFSMKISSK